MTTEKHIDSISCKMQDIVEKIQLPQIPKRDFQIRCTRGGNILPALVMAIDACANAGGGRVIVPSGTFRCNGPIHLKSRMELHLSDGAFIKFSSEPKLYLPEVPTRWEGVELFNYSPMIYGNGLSDVAVTGNGVFCGGAEIWQSWRPQQQTQRVRQLEAQGIPPEQRHLASDGYLRPSMLQLINCERILIEGITLTDTGCWMLHPIYCHHVTIRKIALDSMYINNDGIDVDSCEDVLIEDSVFHNGDDAVVIKSGRDLDGFRVGRPTRRVVVRRCIFAEALHGFAIGSELSGGAEEILVSEIKMLHIFGNALSFKSSRGRGGIIRGIRISNIEVERVRDCLIRIDSNYKNQIDGDAVTEFRDIKIRNVRCAYSGSAFYLQGIAELGYALDTTTHKV